MKKRKEEVLRNKEQYMVQSAVQSTEKFSVQPTVQSNGAYVYGVGIFAILAIGVCVFFAYNTFQPKKRIINEKQDQPPKQRDML